MLLQKILKISVYEISGLKDLFDNVKGALGVDSDLSPEELATLINNKKQDRGI